MENSPGRQATSERKKRASLEEDLRSEGAEADVFKHCGVMCEKGCVSIAIWYASQWRSEGIRLREGGGRSKQ